MVYLVADRRSVGSPVSLHQTHSRGEYYERITKRIRELYTQQQRIGLRILPGPQQIRGIAGSGKTILLAKKAARMLSEPKNWTAADTDPEDVRIAFTFTSKSLYQSLTEQIERFYRHFTGEPLNEATATLDIIHGGVAEKLVMEFTIFLLDRFLTLAFVLFAKPVMRFRIPRTEWKQ